MFPLLRTPFLMSPDTDGTGGGGQADELPAELKDKYISKASHEGTKGQLSQQIKKWQAQAETLQGEKAALESQYAEATKTLEGLKAQAALAETLTKKLGETQAQADTHSALNARLEAAMKYPQLLDEATLALVKSSTMSAEVLESNLSKLAEKFSRSAPGPDPAAGSSPAKPKTAEVKAEDLMLEAHALQTKGDYAGFTAKMNEALSLMDAKDPFLPPEHAAAP